MDVFNDAEVLVCADAAQWESWLAAHHDQPGGVWLKIAKKGTGTVSITIREALDIALCYGWIDSQRNAYDAAYYVQRYSRRRPKSPWSKRNHDRAEALMAAGRIRAPGLAEIRAAQADGRWAAAYESQRHASIPPDFAVALEQNERAKSVFDRLDKTSQYAVILPLLKSAAPGNRAVHMQKAIAKLEADHHVSPR